MQLGRETGKFRRQALGVFERAFQRPPRMLTQLYLMQGKKIRPFSIQSGPQK
jgi:hypothetical protein